MNPDELQAIREALVKREHWDPGVIDIDRVSAAADAVAKGAQQASQEIKTAFDAYLRRWGQALTQQHIEAIVNVSLPTVVLSKLVNSYGMTPGATQELVLTGSQNDRLAITVVMRLDGAWDMSYAADRPWQQAQLIEILRRWANSERAAMPIQELQTVPEKRRPPRRVVRRST